jgi:predicted dienelactone hydrolase
MIADPNVGCRALCVVDEVQAVSVPAWLLYPTRDEERLESFGPYTVSLAVDGTPQGDRMPLAVVSHGTGGTPWSYRDLARSLARSGWTVALIEHTGNSRNDDRLAHTIANLENRPRHVARVLDAVFADELVGPKISREHVGMIGHSIGGYTALAVAGGNPTAMPHETPEGMGRPLAVTHDARVRALVLMAPATPWFLPEGSLSEVDLPILLLTAENDEFVPAEFGAVVERGVRSPVQVEARVVARAGHFAFMSPFPATMVRPEFPPSQDPRGFDREAYQPVLHAEVLDFLRRHVLQPSR